MKEVSIRMAEPLGNMWVHLRRFDVSFMVTCEGSNGLISARLRRISFDTMPIGGGEPAEPTTGRKGGESSFSSDTNQDLSETLCTYLKTERKDFALKLPSMDTGHANGIVIACDFVLELAVWRMSGSDSFLQLFR